MSQSDQESNPEFATPPPQEPPPTENTEPAQEHPGVLYARSLGPGQPNPSLKQRWPAGTKPKLQHLRDEVMRRAPERRPGNYTADQCYAFLVAHRAPDTQGTQASSASSPSPQFSQETGQESVARWIRNRHLPRVVNCILDTKADFLVRKRALTRTEKDAREKDQYNLILATTFNRDDPALDHNQFPNQLPDICPRNTNGFVLDAQRAAIELRDMSSALSRAIANFRRSGQGNDELTHDDMQGEAVWEIASSEFADFVDPPLYYAYLALIESGLLGDMGKEMPPDSVHTGELPSSTTRVAPRTGKTKQPEPARIVISRDNEAKSEHDTTAAAARALAAQNKATLEKAALVSSLIRDYKEAVVESKALGEEDAPWAPFVHRRVEYLRSQLAALLPGDE